MKLFHLHTWSKWSEPFDGRHDYTKLQARFCTECNKSQVKKIRQPWNQWFSASQIKSSEVQK